MADEKLNTGPGEEKLPEAPAPVTADGPQAPAPEQTAAPTPQQEWPAQPEPGDVVVSFDKINELMLRKKGCVPSALTQNVKDLLASREIENILDNTDFMILLSQAQSDRAILARQLGISEHQLSYITHSNSGEGLLFYGNVTIPFVDRFPKGEIYDLLTTRPEDMKNEAKTE